jgi:hypothetical protein
VDTPIHTSCLTARNSTTSSRRRRCSIGINGSHIGIYEDGTSLECMVFAGNAFARPAHFRLPQVGEIFAGPSTKPRIQQGFGRIGKNMRDILDQGPFIHAAIAQGESNPRRLIHHSSAAPSSFHR